MSNKTFIVLSFLLAIITFPLFLHLDSYPLQQWDESRLANSAFEMNRSHNWIVPTVNGSPDMWSTKPPFMIWLQVLAIKLLGASELAVRLPSALAAVGTCLLLFFFFAKKYKKPMLGLVCATVLVTSGGYINVHCTRTGDYDSLLTMLMTGYALLYFLYLEEPKQRHFYGAVIMLILAVLTKGIQGLMFLPALVVYTVYRRKVIAILKQQHFYTGIAAAIFFIAGYYLLREHYNPGYINAVMQNEVSGRYNTTLEHHAADNLFYFNMLVSNQFNEWYLLILPGFAIGFLSKHKMIREITVLSFIISLTYLMVISYAQTKLAHYTMPMMPFLSISAGIFMYSVYAMVSQWQYPLRYLSYNIIPFIFLFLVFILPYSKVMDFCMTTQKEPYQSQERYDMALFLQSLLRHDQRLDSCTFLGREYQQDFFWYVSVLAAQKHELKYIDTSDISSSYKVAVCEPASKQYIESRYIARVVQSHNSVTVYKIIGKR